MRGGCAPLTPSLLPLAPHQPGRSRQHHRPSLHPHYRFSFVNVSRFLFCHPHTHQPHARLLDANTYYDRPPHVRVRDATTLLYDPLAACLPWNWSLALKVWKEGGSHEPRPSAFRLAELVGFLRLQLASLLHLERKKNHVDPESKGSERLGSRRLGS